MASSLLTARAATASSSGGASEPEQRRSRRGTWTDGLGTTIALNDPYLASARRRRVPRHFVAVGSEGNQVTDCATIHREASVRTQLAPGENGVLLTGSHVSDERKPPTVHHD